MKTHIEQPFFKIWRRDIRNHNASLAEQRFGQDQGAFVEIQPNEDYDVIEERGLEAAIFPEFALFSG